MSDPTVLDGHTLSARRAAALARNHGLLRLDPDARRRMERSVQLRDELLDRGDPVYGMTTGFGDSVRRRVTSEHATDLQHNLILGHLCGTGSPAPVAVVRASMLSRANCLARGQSGIRSAVVDRLLAMLEADLTPVVPSRGSLGASGDLVPLAYIAAALLGEGEIDEATRRIPASSALAHAGLSPLVLQPREGLALINGTSFATGYAVTALEDADALAETAAAATALAGLALDANAEHFDERLHRQKPHRGQQRAAETIRAIWQASPSNDRGPLQDPYSLRCAPQVIGVLHDTLDWAAAWVGDELNSSTDNPLLDPDESVALHGGNFYAGHVGHAMEAVKLAVTNVADLLDRQIQLLVDEKFNRGLSPNLTGVHPDDSVGGAAVHHGFKAAQISCSAITAEALQAAAPAMVFSRSSEAHNQDKISMGTTAARQATEVTESATRVLAIHLMAACQALDLRGTELGRPAAAHYHAVREVVAPLGVDRRLDRDTEAVAELVRRRGLGEPTESPNGAPERAPSEGARVTSTPDIESNRQPRKDPHEPRRTHQRWRHRYRSHACRTLRVHGRPCRHCRPPPGQARGHRRRCAGQTARRLGHHGCR